MKTTTTSILSFACAIMKKQSLAVAIVLACTLAFANAERTGGRARDGTYPNEVDTHIGKLTFDQGVPSEETSKKFLDRTWVLPDIEKAE